MRQTMACLLSVLKAVPEFELDLFLFLQEPHSLQQDLQSQERL
jgi:hypothetical protein